MEIIIPMQTFEALSVCEQIEDIRIRESFERQFRRFMYTYERTDDIPIRILAVKEKQFIRFRIIYASPSSFSWDVFQHTKRFGSSSGGFAQTLSWCERRQPVIKSVRRLNRFTVLTMQFSLRTKGIWKSHTRFIAQNDSLVTLNPLMCGTQSFWNEWKKNRVPSEIQQVVYEAIQNIKHHSGVGVVPMIRVTITDSDISLVTVNPLNQNGDSIRKINESI